MNNIISILLLFSISNIQAGIFTRNKCVDVPSNLCAVVYDDEKCNGWKLDINEGEVSLSKSKLNQKPILKFQIMFKWWDPIYYWYRNDIESVSVRKGYIK